MGKRRRNSIKECFGYYNPHIGKCLVCDGETRSLCIIKRYDSRQMGLRRDKIGLSSLPPCFRSDLRIEKCVNCTSRDACREAPESEIKGMNYRRNRTRNTRR